MGTWMIEVALERRIYLQLYRPRDRVKLPISHSELPIQQNPHNMIKNYTHPLLAFVFILLTQSIHAQSAQGCDGTRYVEDIFEEINMTTVYYGTNTDAAGNSFDLEMDIYQPVGDVQEKRPLIVWSHGGAFVGGDRTLMDQYCRDFAKKGFVTATISYRLYPLLQLGIPDSIGMMDAAMKSLGDLKAAIRHFRQDADTDNLYQIDPDYILVAGYSAGAIMSVHAAYLDENDNIPAFVSDVFNENGGIEGSTGDATNQSYSSEVAAVINLSGALHKREWMSEGEPPIASYHGTVDDVVPYNHGFASVLGIQFMSLDGSGVMHQRAEELGIYNFHVQAPGGGHEDSYQGGFSQYLNEFFSGGDEFLQTVLCGEMINTEDDFETAEVTVFPNPTYGEINVEVDQYTQGYHLNLYDQMGRLVKNINDVNEPLSTMQGTDLATGIYYLQVRFNNASLSPKLLKVVME